MSSITPLPLIIAVSLAPAEWSGDKRGGWDEWACFICLISPTHFPHALWVQARYLDCLVFVKLPHEQGVQASFLTHYDEEKADN